MSPQIEQELRELFATDATHAPGPTGLVGGTLRKVRRHRRIRLAQATAAVVLLTAGTLTAAASRPATTRSEMRALSPALSPTQPAGRTGTASCAFGYSPAEVAKRDFSFDGTVLAIDPEPGRHGYQVTLQVNQWFRGGSGDRVTVAMPDPGKASVMEDGFGAPTDYRVGTRLLVSGEPFRDRRGQIRKPLEDPVAFWGCGGFTRLYTPRDAALWAAATR